MYRSRPDLRKGISAAAVLAVVIVVSAGLTVVFLYPSLSGSGATTSPTTKLMARSRSPTTLLSTTGFPATYTFTTPPYSTGSTTKPTVNTTSGGWQEWAVLNATLGYYQTQEYIRTAWNYTFNVVQTATNGRLVYISDYIEAVGPLLVTGNWTTGYLLNYTRVSSLNVTAQYTPGSGYYPVVFFSARNGTGMMEPLQFNSTQQKAISIAVTNNTVEAFTSQFPTFVDAAWVFPSGNKTFGGDYLVTIFQVNGPKTLNVIVSMSGGEVASTYGQARTTEDCFSIGVCFESPWP